MIRGFRHKGIKRLYETGSRSGVRPDLCDKVVTVLTVLDVAHEPADVDMPGYRLHLLKGDRAGFWSVTIRANWRIIFRFEGGNVLDVELIDYH